MKPRKDAALGRADQLLSRRGATGGLLAGAGSSSAERQTIAKAVTWRTMPSGLGERGSPKTRMPPTIWIALATRPIRPIVSIAPPPWRAATAVYWARAPQARTTSDQRDDHQRAAAAAGERLDRDPGEGEEEAGEHRAERRRGGPTQPLGAVAERDPGGEQDQAALEADDRRRAEKFESEPWKLRQGDDEEDEADRADRQRQPLPAPDRVAEEPLREDREGDGAAGEDRLDERDRGQREGGDVGQPGERGERPAGDEPARAGEVAEAGERAGRARPARASWQPRCLSSEARLVISATSTASPIPISIAPSQTLLLRGRAARPGTVGRARSRTEATAIGEVRQAWRSPGSAPPGCGRSRSRSGPRAGCGPARRARSPPGRRSIAASPGPRPAAGEAVGRRSRARSRSRAGRRRRRPSGPTETLAAGAAPSDGLGAHGSGRRLGRDRRRLRRRRFATAAWPRLVRCGAAGVLRRPRGLRGRGRRAIRRISSACSARTKLMPVPVRPARPVRPIAVDVGVAVLGGVVVDHPRRRRGRRSRGRRRRWRPGSSPRRARSGRARCSRWRWVLSPCIATASTFCLRSRLTSRSAPRLVRTKTSERPGVLLAERARPAGRAWRPARRPAGSGARSSAVGVLGSAWVWERASWV